MLRQPRKLHYLKCHQCRKDRQKCTPTDRCWPSRKCDRCIKFSYPCSPNVTARGEVARRLETPQVPQGKQLASLDFNLENHDFGADCTAARPGQSSLHGMENLFSDINQDFPGTSSVEPPLAEKPAPGRVNASGTIFFSQLKFSRWSDKFCCSTLKSLEQEDASDKLRLFRTFFLGRGAAHGLYSMLHQREGLVISCFLQEASVRQEMAKGSSRDKAVKSITADKVAKLLTSGAIKGKSQSAVEDIFAAARRIREADRWRQLVEAFGAREMLLIDAYHPKCFFRSRQSSNSEIYTEFGDVKNLKCCPESQPSFSVDRIIKKGTDETFAKLKATLLKPELQLQATLQRLSGLVSMIHRLFRTDKMDPSTAIYRELSSIFNAKLNLDEKESDWLKSLEEAKLSDPDNLLSEMPSKIEDAFGSGSFQTAIESGDEDDVWDYRVDTRDEDTSDDDDDENDGDKKGDDNDEDNPDEFSGINGEDFGFDEDFCIHFQNSDPFASLPL